MKSFRELFPTRPAFFAVVHAGNAGQVLRNVRIARDNGADGVFLINHAISGSELWHCYGLVRQLYRKWWVGLNFLSLSDREAICTVGHSSVSALWLDNAGVDLGARDATAHARQIKKLQEEQRVKMIFGGVAFKYQKPVPKELLARAAHLASEYIDVVTTSGSGTGHAPDLEKIRTIKRAIGSVPLANASGSSPENARALIDAGVDAFLCATAISDSHSELNPKRVEEMALAML